MSYIYRDPRKAENRPTVAPEPQPQESPAEIQVHPKVKALLDQQKARIKELEAENAAAAENYDTLASVNQNLQEAAAQASERADKAEQEARLARAEADSPSAIKALEELLNAEKQKSTSLTKHIATLKSQLGRSRQRIGAIHQEYEALLEGQHDGTVAIISAEGVELRGPYTTATVEDVAHTLDLAFKLFAQEGSNANIHAALS